MLKFALVFIGAGLGAVARYKLSGLVLHHTPEWRFPLGTFIVNASGCLVAGMLAGLVVRQNFFSADLQLFLFTGLLGGFTTFSAFGVESVYLLQRGHIAVALGYVLSSVCCRLAGVWIGMIVVPHARP
jgi:CrcB protein